MKETLVPFTEVELAGVQITLFQPGAGRGADYAHHIAACPPGFENKSTPKL